MQEASSTTNNAEIARVAACPPGGGGMAGLLRHGSSTMPIASPSSPFLASIAIALATNAIVFTNRCTSTGRAVWTVFGLLLLIGYRSSPAQMRNPDLILYDGIVLTMSDGGAVSEAVAVGGDSILAVGANNDILNLAGIETRVIDLAGRTVIPGFVDAHSHLFSEAASRGMTLQQVHGIALAFGVTALGNVFVNENLVKEMRAFEQDNRLRIRTSLYLSRTDNCGVDLGDWYLAYPPTREPHERLRIGGVKIFADGGTCGHPATSFESRYGRGDLWRSQAEMDDLVAEVDAAGYQLAIHAVGDRAVEQTLNSLETVLDGGPNRRRHRIEHNSFVREDLLKRYDNAGAVAVLFGRYPTCAEVNFGALSNRYGEENVKWMEDWRSLLAANPNLHAAWHSDYPFLVLDPIRHLSSYVTRAQVDADGTLCRPPAWLAEHSITAREALTLMTRGAAYALDWDDEIGSIESGKLADLVILSQDPTSVAPGRIIETEILATFIGGSLVYCRQGNERVCGLPVDVKPEGPDPEIAGITSIYPNPASGGTAISFRLDARDRVKISVHEVLGRRITTLVDRVLGPGHHRAVWRGERYPPGVYLVELKTSSMTESATILRLP